MCYVSLIRWGVRYVLHWGSGVWWWGVARVGVDLVVGGWLVLIGGGWVRVGLVGVRQA